MQKQQILLTIGNEPKLFLPFINSLVRIVYVSLAVCIYYSNLCYYFSSDWRFDFLYAESFCLCNFTITTEKNYFFLLGIT